LQNAGLVRATSVRYTFLTSSGRILHTGKNPYYVVGPAAAGAKVHCLATATGAGGITLQRSVDSDTVKPRAG
jgi:hypothetical protein